MNKRLVKRTILSAFLPCLVFMATFSSTAPSFWDAQPGHDLITAITEEMTDTELLGQVFFLGYVGKTPSPEILNFIKNRNLGGLKIFTRNVSTVYQTAGDIHFMQQASQQTRFKIPMFVATDQEGGWVLHIRGDVSRTGGNLSLGAAGIPKDAYTSAFFIGEELKAMGINMNYAPNLDIYSNSDADAVGPRSFSQNPKEVGLFGVAYLRGMIDSGIIATGKHFPGHGATNLDSHGYLPEINISFDTLYERELLPYRMAIREGLPAIMSAHLAFPQITHDKTPATLSKFFLTDVLRGKLGFKGIVVTDDMEMNGVLLNGNSTATACYKAIMAGADMVLVSHTPAQQEHTWQLLIGLMKTDPAFRQRVKTSVERILTLKFSVFRGEKPFPFLPDLPSLSAKIPAPDAPDFFFQSLCRGSTIVGDNRIPFVQKPEEKVLIAAHYADFIKEGKIRYPEADTLLIPWSSLYYATEEEIRLVTQKAASYDTVIVCLSSLASLDILKRLERLGNKVIVVSALTPVYLKDTPWVKSAVAVYGESREAFKIGFAILAGDFTPEGRLPFDFLD
ncbi:MAG: glycoside hydrolase family 3 protein [Spirochaetales bacterium]|nr:glycoside hydrolase family 3 protein [Spirochaetales bacterium]